MRMRSSTPWNNFSPKNATSNKAPCRNCSPARSACQDLKKSPLQADRDGVDSHWTAAGMMEAAKGFRRLKAYKYLPVLRAALAAHQSKYVTQRVEHDADAA